MTYPSPPRFLVIAFVAAGFMVAPVVASASWDEYGDEYICEGTIGEQFNTCHEEDFSGYTYPVFPPDPPTLNMGPGFVSPGGYHFEDLDGNDIYLHKWSTPDDLFDIEVMQVPNCTAEGVYVHLPDPADRVAITYHGALYSTGFIAFDGGGNVLDVHVTRVTGGMVEPVVLTAGCGSQIEYLRIYSALYEPDPPPVCDRACGTEGYISSIRSCLRTN